MKAIHPAGALLVLGPPGRRHAPSRSTRSRRSAGTKSDSPFRAHRTVHLTTFDGAIEIQSWDKPDVLVEMEKRGSTQEAVDALEVKSSQDGNTIEFEVKKPEGMSLNGFGFHHSASAKLIVSVPRNADIRARSGDGSIRIAHVTGPDRTAHGRRQHQGRGCIGRSDLIDR